MILLEPVGLDSRNVLSPEQGSRSCYVFVCYVLLLSLHGSTADCKLLISSTRTGIIRRAIFLK